MNRFCATHVTDRTRAELAQRLTELTDRDLSDKPGLVRERIRVADRILELDRAAEAERVKAAVRSTSTEELDSRPLDVPEDPDDAPILRAVVQEYRKRSLAPPEDADLTNWVPDEGDEQRLNSMMDLDADDAYLLGWADCIAYFRQLANGSTFEVHMIEFREDTDGAG